jgi:SAM-dependent methyltransferase
MPVIANRFQDWFNSPYYHLLYSQQDQQAVVSLVNKLLDFLQPAPGSRIVDLACGQGMIAKFLSEKGYDVTGIDLAPATIETALENEKQNLHFFQHDLRLPFWVNYFDVGLQLFSRFGFYKTEHDHYNAVRTISNSLKPGGRFVLDYKNVLFEEKNLVPKLDMEISGVKYLITNWFDETDFYKKIVIEDENAAMPLEYTEKMARFNLGDFTDMMAFHHLQIQEVFGDYDLRPYDINSSPRLLMIAKKL